MTTSEKQQNGSFDNIKPLLDERAELTMAKKRIQERIKELDKDIRPVLANRGSIICNGYEHTVKKLQGPKSVNYKQMAEDYGVDLEDYTEVGAPTTRYDVKAVNEI